MVVGQDQRGSRDGDRRLVHLAGMDDRGVEAPDRDDLAAKDLVSRVEVEADEVLAVGCPDVPAEVEDRLGTTDEGRGIAIWPEPPSQLDRGQDHASAVGTDALHRRQLLGWYSVQLANWNGRAEPGCHIRVPDQDRDEL